MRILSKYKIQGQLIFFITIIFTACGIVGTLLIYQKISRDRNQEQVSAARESLLNFERLNLDNFETYDYHEIFRNLNQYKFPPQAVYVVLTDRAGNIVTERLLTAIADSPDILKSLRDDIGSNHPTDRGLDEILSDNGFLHFIKTIRSADDTVLARFHLLLDFQQIKYHSFLYGVMLIGLLLVCLALILAIVLFISGRVMMPISKFHNHLQNSKNTTDSFFQGYHDFPVDIRNLVMQYNVLISELKETEDKSKRQAIDAAIGKTATQVAHDIRSPLSSLQAALMLLREQCGDNENIQDPLNLLQLSSKRLNDIANGLLAKHKGEESQTQFFSIHEIMDELIGELQSSPLGKGTEFKKQYHADALYVSGDKTGLTRAMGNIIKNALEAMQKNIPDRPKQLTVATACHPEPQAKDLDSSVSTLPQNDKVCIRITDTGPGIPADKIPLILQGGHTEGKADGHGIGTKVIKEMVENHKGHLAIESEVGVGTSFIMTLPAVDVGVDHGETTTVTIPYIVGNTVYVIDDDAGLREQWRLTLKTQGVVPTIYTCWEEYAACHPEAQPPPEADPPLAEKDLDSSLSAQNDNVLPRNATFIIDYHFDNSEVDGLEIIRRLKARGYSHFALATAEYWKPAIKDTALKLGAILCPKPLPRVVVQNCHPEEAVVLNNAVILSEVKDLSTDPSAAPQDDKTLPRTDKVGTTVLLIDDGEEIRLTWLALKKHLGIATLHSFPSLEAAIQASVDPSQCDLCVIDKNIDGSQYDGARMLEYLKQNGAKTVLLATGELESDIRKDPQFDTIDGIIADKIPMSLDDYLQ